MAQQLPPDGIMLASEMDDEQAATAEQERIAKLDAMGLALVKKRSEAIQARAQSGIEQQWIEDEEFYQGIDDANRSEHSNAWRTKPPGQIAPTPAGTTRSTVFVNITRPYVDAAAARIADMLLPNDDRNWSLKPTPIPDLVEIGGGEIPAWMQQEMAAEPGVDQAKIQQMQAAIVEQANRVIDDAKKMADKAQKRIEDWQIEGQWHAEVRRVIEDAARCGSGVLKGPVPVKRRVVAIADLAADGTPEKKPNVFQRLVNGIKSMLNLGVKTIKGLVIKDEIKPTSKRIDFWNFFPDGACGDNIHNGAYTWERDYLTPRQLRDLKGTPGYIDSQIEECLTEGPLHAVATSKEAPDEYARHNENDPRFEIWYYHGGLEKEELRAAGCDCPDGEDVPNVPAMVTVVNNRVIRAAMNPLDSGDFPYDIMPWQRRTTIPWGVGVARQGRTAQRIVVAGARNMMDNAGLSAGPQIIINQGVITPADGNYTLVPRKVWLVAEDADVEDVQKAITFVEVLNIQQELLELVQFGLKMMEDSTGLPMLLQGQLGKAPDTVGGMTMLNNNASAVLRRLARTFDDCVTEPHIRRYYTWLLQYGEDDEKGDCQIDARGSSALVERDLQSQQLPQILQASGNPIFKIDPAKTMQELLKAWHFNPKNFEYDDEKWQQIVESLGKKPQDPREAIAQFRAQADERLKQMEQQFEASEADKDRQVELLMAQVKERIETLKQGGAKEMSFEELKAMLADTAMKLATQRAISAATLATDVHKHHNPAPLKAVTTPPTEPAGRAPAGQSFAR